MTSELRHKRAATRRGLLALAATGGVGVALFQLAPMVFDLAARDLNFVPIADPAGFRRLSLVGATTNRLDPFVGLNRGDGAPSHSDLQGRNFCAALFGQTRLRPEVVPIAYFSDFNCPNCDVIAETLLALETDAGNSVLLKQHEWPILGRGSEIFARAAIAAGMQGARRPISQRLQRTSFAPSEAYLQEIAAAAGIDPARFLSDMNSAAVTEELETSAALVRRFGFPGTPALVVGRTVVVGAIRTSALEALVAAERQLGPPPGCG